MFTPQEANPQTTAMLLAKVSQKRLESIAQNGCCAFVLRWCLGLEGTDYDAILALDGMIEAGVLQSDCTVVWEEAIKYITGKKSVVTFKSITTIKDIKERTPVRFDYNGKSHWVGVEDGKVAFNPLKYSVCVDRGKPTTARIINLL